MLSPEQITARHGKLTASRVAVLMNGDARGVLRLWQELTDDPAFVPEDLSRIWPVQLGTATEQLQLDWFEQKNRLPVIQRGYVIVHEDYPWAACTLDGWCMEYPLEVKHVGGREPLEVIVERYQPQMQWQMFVTGAKQCALSVIMGASEPIVEYIERDEDYIAEMVKRGEQFMTFVEKRIQPVALPPVAAPIVAAAEYDMGELPQWQAAADQWKQTYGAAQSAKDAERILKNLVPEDAKKCFGAGVRITRDRVGRLSLREETE